jgi:gamma-glutamylcyclotransferase (GGCT)/AIG2-like uncharacterized protein YtfP
MSTDFVFAYGSSMNSSDLRSWLESNGFDSSLVVNRWPATLEGYDLVWNYYSSKRRGGAANLQPREKSVVWGVLIEFEEPLLKAFDRKEGHPVFCSRGEKRLSVQRMTDNQKVDAWVYTAKPNKGGRTDVWPTRDYRKIILDAAEEMNFPEDRIERIRNWKTED